MSILTDIGARSKSAQKLLAKAGSAAIDKALNAVADAPIPQHIAFICDGNRRWAEMRGLPPLMGHQVDEAVVRMSA